MVWIVDSNPLVDRKTAPRSTPLVMKSPRLIGVDDLSCGAYLDLPSSQKNGPGKLLFGEKAKILR